MKPVLVAIVGGSSSGKSWLAQRLAELIPARVVRLSMDDFYLDRSHLSPARRSKINYDHPRAIDWRLFERSLRRLRSGEPAQVPQYDFKTHSRLPGYRTIKPAPFVIIDGLWLLRRPKLRKLFDLSVFLDCSRKTRLKRRLSRDCITRGRTLASVRDQFRRTVEPMHVKFVMPQAELSGFRLKEGFPTSRLRVLAELL